MNKKAQGFSPLTILVFFSAKAQTERDAQVHHMNVTAKDSALNE